MGVNDFKKGYQPRTNVVKNEKGDVIVFWLGNISLSY